MTINEALQKAVKAYNAGETGTAKRLFARVIEIEPNQPEANHNMGLLLVKSGDIEAAIPFFKTALEANFSAAQYWFSYINALFKLGLFTQASELLVIAKTKGCNGKAFDDLEKSLTLVEIKLETSNKALSLKPNYAEAYYNMGIALQEQGKLEEAIEAYNKALAIKPDNAEAYNNMGAALKEQGKLDEAIEAYNKALSLKPDYAEAYSNMGNALQEQGKLEEAIEAYSKALSLKPDYAEAYYNMGIALQEQGKLEEAIEAYNKALYLKPDYAEAYSNMGIALQEQGKLDEALEAYSKALSLKPDYAEASDNMALALYSTGQFQKAASLFRKNSSSKSQTRLLKCLYELDNQSDFYQQLDYLINQGENNAVIGSYISRSKVRYGIDRENPFCNEPLKYASKIDLAQKCDFKDVFVEGAIKILSEGIVQSRKQELLNKGSQTAGNVFDQMGPHTNKIQDIIRMEIEDYRLRFKESREGLITSWPAKYRLNGWIVKMKNGGAIKPHMHDEGWISGSVYINVPPKLKEDSGNLVVCLESETRKTDEGEYSKSIDVVTGSLCLFPSSLLHYTIPFNADEDRIVMAFDVVPE